MEELRWRGMLQDVVPGTEELLQEQKPVSAYIGFDPTADSLHIGSLVPIMMLVHFQRAGHRPVVLVGGATGMVGDPSGKSAERNLQTLEEVEQNSAGIYQQLSRFLQFGDGPTDAVMVNNYDWFSSMSFLDFIRDIGKHLTVNYMMAKESVQKRLETGLSFTEFSYQLIQAYDFLHLYQHKDCKLQMGGSDQWGNITSGTELIRRKVGGEAYGLTSPLVKKADGTKFGKTEQGNVWLDPERTTPYAFYQFWLNASDEDARNWIKIFTLRSREEVEELIRQHEEAPHQRILQHTLAEDVTVFIHGREELEQAQEASRILFGKGSEEMLRKMNPSTLLAALEGVPQYEVPREKLSEGIPVADLLAVETETFPSKGEVNRTVKQGGLRINKEQIQDAQALVTEANLINESFLVVQRGKKNYYLLKAVR